MEKANVHKHVHFIGIGGISMSALAHTLLVRGYKVTGSDGSDSSIIEVLRKDGAEIHIGQRAENISNPDLVVYTAAISKDNPELVAARDKGIKTMERADFLGMLMLEYEMPISISGTHGKTTTTSMLSSVMLGADLDPTVLVGGEFNMIGGNYKIGSEKYLVFEGCEYVDSFLKFNPYSAIILNIEEDHLDYFSGIDQIIESFNKFMKKIPKHGFVVINADDQNVLKAAKDVECEKITYGKSGEFSYANISYDENGCASFDVMHKDSALVRISLSVGGAHNVSNALAVFAAAYRFGVSPEVIARGISDFTGTKRRFEYKGEINGAKIYDDYAHHPTEILATHSIATNMQHNKTHIIFQPHTFSRTKALFSDFVSVLSKYDNVIITDIYAAREKNTVGITAQDLAAEIKNARYISDFSDIAKQIKESVKPGDIVITMGAGTITKLSDFILNVE